MTRLKERIHRLIDDLPAGELPVAQRFLEYLRDAGADPFLRALSAAPPDDEPFTDADRDAVSEARAAISRGEIVAHRRVPRRLKR